jgi:hypothetical protein
MERYQTLGDENIKQEFIEEHCLRLEKWFNPEGKFVYHGTEPGTRERIWNCFSLMSHDDKKYHQLAEQIIVNTPLDSNAFTPGASAELFLRHRERLSEASKKHLKYLMYKHMGNLIDIRFSNPGTNNFSTKTTLLLLAASQILDGYEHQHELATIPQVYSHHRLRDIGKNGVYSMAYVDERREVFDEWNSPTYSPISALALAGIVDLIDDEEIKEIALKMELKLWRELLAMFHPELSIPCGPYSRSYRVDILGQNSNLKLLMIYLGLAKEKSIVKQFDESRPGLCLHHDHDIPFNWAQQAWDIAGKYHVPEDALEELRNRTYPHKFTASTKWPKTGFIENKKFFPVQGDLFPAGKGEISQTQGANWSIGFRSDGLPRAHCFPGMFHYATKPKVKEMDDVRSVTLGTIFYTEPTEWVLDADGRKVDDTNFNNEGKVLVNSSDDGKTLNFEGSYFPEFAEVPSNELSFNSFIPLHFGEVDSVTMNGKEFAGEPIIEKGSKAVFKIKDAGFEYEISYEFDQEVELKLFRWCNFIRMSGFWYQGENKEFTPDFLGKLKVNAEFKLTECAK